MAGIVLYIITLVIESISVVVRFGIVSILVSLCAGGTTGLVAGIIAGIAPVIYSVLVVSGIPSGHILVRRSLEARPLSQAEQATLNAALAPMRSKGIPLPQHIFAVDNEGLNAAISGRTMYIYRELFSSRYLPGVVAHEIGHFNSMDGRLLLGIRALTFPGGFVLAYLLLNVLRWVAYGISTVLVALLVIIFAFFRINLSWLAKPLFGISMQIMRMSIIFAVGGVGPALLGSIWRSYLLEREFAADAYAGRLGYANDLIAFFETEILSDVSIPWYEQPTHPSATRRMANLEDLANHAPQMSQRAAHEQPPEVFSPDPAPRRSHRPIGIALGLGLVAALLIIGILIARTPTD
ncbi:MAG: M48 family metalloprotease, partial [Oscillochloris sp.]|nr:M48 family metalloprotease [Oscillochloris sp.]